jgi:hypothetical protein
LHFGKLLESTGSATRDYEFAEARATLVACIGGSAERAPPSIILGPSELATMRKTGEGCSTWRTETAVEIYEKFICAWFAMQA